MADTKISALPAATTPLAGTEVLPIVQSSATKKVASDDLTVKNVRSNATTGILQIAGPSAGATRTMTTPDANFTAARTDAAQSFTGDQTLGTGNLIVGTSGKGIDFSANTGAAGMTSELLTWYEEGTFTPTILGDATPGVTTYTTQIGRYTRIGRCVNFRLQVTWTNMTGTGNLIIGGLPFTSANDAFVTPCATRTSQLTFTANGFVVSQVQTNSTNIYPVVCLNNTAVGLIAVDTTGTINVNGSYFV